MTIVEGTGSLTSAVYSASDDVKLNNKSAGTLWDIKQEGAVLSAPLLLKLLESGNDRWYKE